MSSEPFLYLTTTGRCSGLPRQIEIWYVEHNQCFYIVSEHQENAHWVKNILNKPVVLFSVGMRTDPESVQSEQRTLARTIRNPKEPNLVNQVLALMNAKYGWSDGLIVELKQE